MGVLWGLILPVSLLDPLYQQFCGQGRGRTADLPIFRTTVIRSHLFANVLDLCRKRHPDIGERWRTKTNETEKETETRSATGCGYTRRPATAAGLLEGVVLRILRRPMIRRVSLRVPTNARPFTAV